MSNYEGMNGSGTIMKKDLGVLKKLLIDSHNAQISGMKPSFLKQNELKKASSRTTSFPIFRKYEDDENTFIDFLGNISLNATNGTFHFSIDENNHAVDHAGEYSKSFNALMNFLRKLPTKGEKYGAETYYYSEYDEDEYGHRTAGHTEKYGAWAELSQIKRMKRGLA